MFNKALLLLALSVKTLSLPSTNEALQKRDTRPWIGCFETADRYCQHGNFGVPGSRPHWGLGGCDPFTVTLPRIGMWNFSIPLQTYSACTLDCIFVGTPNQFPSHCHLTATILTYKFPHQEESGAPAGSEHRGSPFTRTRNVRSKWFSTTLGMEVKMGSV